MKAPKSFLQRTATVSGKFSFAAAIVCAVFLYLKTQELGSDDPVTASFIAGIFFFVFVGGLLLYIGNADIPSFKPGDGSDG